ncbi:MAG: phosphosulfolactate synthase [Balneolaceae bacterium]
MSFELSNLPERSEKPRNHGLTMVIDSGLSTGQTENLCDSASHLFDMVKLGWGTAIVTKNLEAKLAVYSRYNIPVFFGGTLFEAFVMRNELAKFKEIMHGYNIRHMEISNGTVRLSQKKKINYIKEFSRDFTVLSEVGSKDPDNIMPPYQWVDIIRKELDAGAWKVICEARESGNVGVFRPNGEIRSGLIEEIAHSIPSESLIFEAPHKDQQVWFIKKFGSNVNLGNISPAQVIPVETLRLGLRSDTLFDFLGMEKSVPSIQNKS